MCDQLAYVISENGVGLGFSCGSGELMGDLAVMSCWTRGTRVEI